VGTVLAYLLVRKADVWGRKRVLTWTIVGYTLATFATGLAPNPWVFCACQAVARVFLIGEYATSMVIAAEEFPASRRGMVIGVIAAFSSLGAIVCAGTVPLLVQSPYGWRTVYFVAIVPLVIVAFARRGLRETARFAQQGAHPEVRPLLAIWKTPHRRRVVELGAIWFVAYIATQNTVTFWKDYAVTERGLNDAQVGGAIAVAAVASLPLVFGMGKAMDKIGRRPTAAIVFTAGALGTFGAYTLHGRVELTVALVLAIFASGAFLPVMNAFTAELFPTEMRGDGFAWANNILGRLGYVVSPVIIGHFAHGLGWGPVVRLTAAFPLLAILLVFLLLPETRGRSLEETAAL
jgi:putative MFS transporter